MPVCSYVVVPRDGERDALQGELDGMPDCEVAPASNADILLLVTDTTSFEADVRLRQRVEALPGIQALLLTFGEVDPETPVGDPVRDARRVERPRGCGPGGEGPPSGFAPRSGEHP